MRFASGEDCALGQPPEPLPPAERALRYRIFADEAFRKAEQAETPEIRAGLLNMAAGWHVLATALESAIRAVPPPDGGQRDFRKSLSAD